MPHIAWICLIVLAVTGCTDSRTPSEPDEQPRSATVASVTVSGAGDPLRVGETAQLSAVVRDAEGEAIDGVTVEWSTNAPHIAMVTGSGLATAVAPGEAVISASAGGRAGSLSIEVSAPPASFARGTIAYVKDDELRLIEPDGSGDRSVWTLPDTLFRISATSWRPDGDEITFASDHEMAVSFYERDIYAIRPDGSGLRKLTNAPAHSELESLPKGTVTVTVENLTFDGGPYFVYVTGAEEPQLVTLGPGGDARLTFTGVADLGEGINQPVVVINGIYRWWNAATAPDVRAGATVDAGVVTVTANPVEHFGAEAPFWRGDGSAVGFIGTPTCLLQQVPAFPPPGPSYEPLIDADVWDSVCAVDWTPLPSLEDPLLLSDMSSYAETGETHIHRVAVGSGARGTPVVTFDGYVRVVDMRWLPDGSGFVVARQDDLLDEDINLYEFDFGTATLRKLTDFSGGFVRSFSISPDGESIVFERISGGSIYDLATLPSDLWVMRRDGSDARLLVTGGRSPAW